MKIDMKTLEVASKLLMVGGVAISGLSALVNSKLQQLHAEEIIKQAMHKHHI